MHVIVIPKLMTPLWLRGLNKVGDLSFVVPAENVFWNKEQHEKLIVAFVFPFLPYRPWQLCSTPKMLAMGRELSKVFQAPEMAGGGVLQKFLLEVRAFLSLPSRVVWRVLYFRGHPPFPLSLSTNEEERHGGRRRRRRERREVQAVELQDEASDRFQGGKRRRFVTHTI